MDTKNLEIRRVPLDSLHLDPANARTHDERNLEAIKASLTRFSQQKPIVVDRRGIIRAGNATAPRRATRKRARKKTAQPRAATSDRALAGTETTSR